MIAAAPTGRARLQRRMRQRRAAKIVLAIVFAIIWVPVTIVMIVAGSSDRRA